MHVKREPGYGKGAVAAFVIGYGLLPFWASCALVLISGGHGTGAEGWVFLLGLIFSSGTLFIAWITLGMHAKAAGDPQEGSRHNMVLGVERFGCRPLVSRFPTSFISKTLMGTHEARIGILRRMGYASLVFWPAALMGDHPYNEDLVSPLLLSYGVLPFITARVAKRAFQQGRILKGVSCVGSDGVVHPVLQVAAFGPSGGSGGISSIY